VYVVASQLLVFLICYSSGTDRKCRPKDPGKADSAESIWATGSVAG
jgi:hypothetical protein